VWSYAVSAEIDSDRSFMSSKLFVVTLRRSAGSVGA